MSNDLISRKEVLQVLEDVFAEYRMSWGREHGGFGAAAQEVIEELPTAFDKKEVIKELKGEIELVAHNPMIAGRYIKKSRAIEIVEKGGIE